MNNKTNTDLLPCPFCGSAARLTNGYSDNGSTIRCQKNSEDCPIGPYAFEPAPWVEHIEGNPQGGYWLDFSQSDAKAIERWNRRYDHAAAELRWIPIRSADDLPKENGYYLATCGSVGIDPDDTTSHELNWFGGKWYLPSDEMIEMDGVIAWMEKPKPYTEPADNMGEEEEK